MCSPSCKLLVQLTYMRQQLTAIFPPKRALGQSVRTFELHLGPLKGLHVTHRRRESW